MMLIMDIMVSWVRYIIIYSRHWICYISAPSDLCFSPLFTLHAVYIDSTEFGGGYPLDDQLKKGVCLRDLFK